MFFCFTLYVEFPVIKHTSLFLFYKLSLHMQFTRKHLVIALTVLFFCPDGIPYLKSTGSTIKKVQHSAQHIAFTRHADDANCPSVNNVTMQALLWEKLGYNLQVPKVCETQGCMIYWRLMKLYIKASRI